MGMIRLNVALFGRLGWVVLRCCREQRFLAPLPGQRLPGVGSETAQTLAQLGITQIGQLAGLAMVPSLRSALTGAMVEPSARLRALFTLLLTATDVSLLGIGAPRRALVVGLLTTQIAARTET